MSANVSTATKNLSKTAAFVMPVFLDNGVQSVKWLNEAVDSVKAQTDPDWKLVMVNDQSPSPNTAAELKRLQDSDGRIHVITSKANNGAGMARNMGVQWAYDNGFPYILFLDYDDVAHPKRVETIKRIMASDPSVGVVYSTIIVIDENSREVPEDKLSGSIQEILECNRTKPPQGETAWIDIGTVTGYANQTSSTTVRTDVAFKHPFPDERAIEDAHAWFRYGAEGKKFVYTADIPALYRIPQSVSDSAMRDRMGGVDIYYAKQCDIERDGFERAIDIAIAKGNIEAKDRKRLMTGYHVRMAESMRRVNQPNLLQREIERARKISPRHAREWINFHGYDWAT
jgi:glycosyltransferase involved in cell wall biosynthesis